MQNVKITNFIVFRSDNKTNPFASSLLQEERGGVKGTLRQLVFSTIETILVFFVILDNSVQPCYSVLLLLLNGGFCNNCTPNRCLHI
jgi:hypothetical protein